MKGGTRGLLGDVVLKNEGKSYSGMRIPVTCLSSGRSLHQRYSVLTLCWPSAPSVASLAADVNQS